MNDLSEPTDSKRANPIGFQGSSPVFLIALLVLILATAWPREEIDPTEASAILLAQSLLEDGDRVFGIEDEARFSSWFEETSRSAGSSITGQVDDGGRFESPLALGLYLSPWVWAAGETGAFLGLALLLACSLWVLNRHLRPRLFDDSPKVIALFFLGSALFPAALHLWSETFLAAVVLLFFGLLYRGEVLVGVPTELFSPPGLSGNREAFRFVVLGILLAVLVASQPTLVVFIFPLFAAVRRQRIGTVSGVGLLLALGLSLWALGALEQGFSSRLVESVSLDPDLWKWNLAYLFVGRHIGLLLFFAPLLLLPWCGREQGRRALWAAVLLGTLLVVGCSPFDYSGLPWTVGARAWIPLFAGLLFLIDRTTPRLPTALTLVLAVLSLWPSWTHLREPAADSSGRAAWDSGALSRWLPWETTQRGLSAVEPLETMGIQLAFVNPGAWKGADGQMRVMGSVWSELMVISDYPVTGLRFESDEEGGVEIELRNAELRQSVFRPDGSVGFLLSLQEPKISHSSHAGTQSRYYRSFSLRLSQAPRRPIRVRIGGVETALIEDLDID